MADIINISPNNVNVQCGIAFTLTIDIDNLVIGDDYELSAQIPLDDCQINGTTEWNAQATFETRPMTLTIICDEAHNTFVTITIELRHNDNLDDQANHNIQLSCP
ncbi:hypothetical protein [Ekhidna sp. To15]|uniref:hypothetical protein n=1 Tax=Ekhidna sp. To15 TaxID=3395267 RepID=UPI003F523CFE